MSSTYCFLRRSLSAEPRRRRGSFPLCKSLPNGGRYADRPWAFTRTDRRTTLCLASCARPSFYRLYWQHSIPRAALRLGRTDGTGSHERVHSHQSTVPFLILHSRISLHALCPPGSVLCTSRQLAAILYNFSAISYNLII